MRSRETQGSVFHGLLMGKQHMDGERLKKGLQGIRTEKRPISWGIFLISGDGCTVWGLWVGVWGILYGMSQMSLTLPCTEGDKSNPRADFQPHHTFIFSSSYSQSSIFVQCSARGGISTSTSLGHPGEGEQLPLRARHGHPLPGPPLSPRRGQPS